MSGIGQDMWQDIVSLLTMCYFQVSVTGKRESGTGVGRYEDRDQGGQQHRGG